MKAANPPPKTISIRRSSGSTGYTESVESDSLEPSTRVDDAIPDAIPENGALNDSFYQKIESDKFYINTVNEEHQEENSFPSKVGGSQLDNELSHQELMNLVEQLYHNLKVSGSALKKEKSRRRSREKTIIKLAKELSNQKGIIRQQQGENDEVRHVWRLFTIASYTYLMISYSSWRKKLEYCRLKSHLWTSGSKTRLLICTKLKEIFARFTKDKRRNNWLTRAYYTRTTESRILQGI